MTNPQPNTLADTLLQLLMTRGLTDEAAFMVLGQVIVESPAYPGKWSTPSPEFGYDPDELTKTAT